MPTEQEDRFKRALEGMERLLGKERVEQFKRETGRGWRVAELKDFTELTMSHAFNDVWMRPGLDLKTRCMLNIAMMACMRQWDELKNYMRSGMRNGVTPGEIVEILLQVSAYGGMAAAHKAYVIMIDLFREQGIDERRLAGRAGDSASEERQGA